jgi:hypothetical protein
VSAVSPASRHDLTDAQWAVLVPRHVCPRQLVDAAAAFNQEPSPRGVTGASGIALADFGLRMSWSACHPHAISEGQSRYRADNHGHRRRPLSWPRHAPPARTHPANMPDRMRSQVQVLAGPQNRLVTSGNAGHELCGGSPIGPIPCWDEVLRALPLLRRNNALSSPITVPSVVGVPWMVGCTAVSEPIPLFEPSGRRHGGR